jgi:uncharacterized iron-regulated membrane protein
MPGFRMLLRIAPFMVGLVAVHVWLRRREVERKALAAPTARFQRRPIDIVTVVDDLLLAGR